MQTEDVASRVQEIVRSYADPDRSVADRLCDSHPADAVAFTFVGPEAGQTVVTYGQLADRSRRAASVLYQLGVRRGDRVASLMGKGVELPTMMLGTWRLGAVYVPLFTAFAGEAVSDRLERADAKVVVVDVAQFEKVATSTAVTVVVGDAPAGSLEWEHLVDVAEPWTGDAPTGPDVPLVHMFTSGTTGKPKAVVHPISYVAGWQSYLEFGLGVDAASRFWCGADPGWAYGLYTAIVGPLASGIPSILATSTFSPGASWDVLEDLRVTDFAVAPTALRAMRNSGDERPLPDLRRLSSAGEPLTPDVLEWTRTLGVPVHDHFGQTEVGMPAGFPHHPAIEVPVVAQAMGASLPGWEVLVIDAVDDAPAPTGTTGRLAIAANSPFLTFTGYGVDRDSPGDRFTADGRYYLTGDLATLDENGILHFSSRDDDVILMAGYRIGPFEIESSLLAHAAVREVAVVAAPDEARGEVVCAFVVLGDGTLPSDELAEELRQWVRRNYGAHAYPRRIEFVDALPKTESGKIQRAVLRRGLAEPSS